MILPHIMIRPDVEAGIIVLPTMSFAKHNVN